MAACHADARTPAETHWLQILTLYDLLLRYDRSPVVRLNRAVALAEVQGPADGLREVDGLVPELNAYYLLHATRAELFSRLGLTDAASEANRRAYELAVHESERRLLARRLASRQ